MTRPQFSPRAADSRAPVAVFRTAGPTRPESGQLQPVPPVLTNPPTPVAPPRDRIAPPQLPATPVAAAQVAAPPSDAPEKKARSAKAKEAVGTDATGEVVPARRRPRSP